MNSTNIPTSTEEKDVGVIISNDLRPSRHCAEIVRRATTILYWKNRAFYFRDRNIFVRLTKTYVRCHLEYASPAGSPWLRSDNDVLEKVQQRMSNMIPGLARTYEEK